MLHYNVLGTCLFLLYQNQLQSRTTLPSLYLICYNTQSQLRNGWRNMMVCFLSLRNKSRHNLDTHDWDAATEWCEFIDLSIRLHQSLWVNLFISHSSQMSAKDISDFFFSFSFRCNGYFRILGPENNALTFPLNINGMILLK